MNFILLIIEPIIRALIFGVDFYMQKTAKDDQAKKDYMAFQEIMIRKGLKSVKLRLESIDQIDRVREQWSKETDDGTRRP